MSGHDGDQEGGPAAPGGRGGEWLYETAPDLDATLVQRLEGFPREPDMLVYALRSIAAVGLRGWLRLYHRLTIRGREHLPAESCVLVANHQSHLDTLAILSALPLRRLHAAFPAAAKDYFFESLPRLAVAAVVVNALPFAREGAGARSLRLCRSLLRKPGNVLILFPEGTRSVTGELGEFLPGVGAILAGCPVPAVPCYIAGAHAAWPKGRALPRPRRVSLTIGAPLRFDDRERSKQSAAAIARELRAAVAALAAPRPTAGRHPPVSRQRQPRGL